MEIEFWFSIGSTYSYLALSQLSTLEKEYGVRFVMKPFNVRKLMMEQAGNPFLNNEKKMAYMWRDIERRAVKYGVAAKFPVEYPIEQFELTNQMAVLAAQEGWCRDFALRVYHHWFVGGLSPAAGKIRRKAFLMWGKTLKECSAKQPRRVQRRHLTLQRIGRGRSGFLVRLTMLWVQNCFGAATGLLTQ